MKLYVGCDLGGTNLRAALVDAETGRVLLQKATATLARQGPEAVMQRMANLILEVIAEGGYTSAQVQGIGVGAPGLLDMEKGETLFLTNFAGNWPHVPLRDTLQRLTSIPTTILNDARAITFGEWRFGAGEGVATMVVFALGTGVGGGSVVNGQLHLGLSGSAGELGHIVLDPNGPRCGCGNNGCLEVYASGPAIAAMGMKMVAQGLATQIADLCQGDYNRITAALIAEAAQRGDEIALEIYRRAGEALGRAAAILCVTLSPQRIVLTGGVAQAGELLLGPMRETMRRLVRVIPVEQVELVPGKLGDQAGVIGAACFAAEKISR
ncbi:MAG: ROK family protein [Anaerolineales bacterium]|nr:ROK family protein [Anaerolineales bacterium]MDW8161320.1 ROK family protein [Anaerolineales bacterium]